LLEVHSTKYLLSGPPGVDISNAELEAAKRHAISNVNNSHSVLLQEKVYIGGGEAETDKKACTVMMYDPHSEEWNTLPEYKARSFGMAAINDQLVLVGGRNPSTGRKFKQVAV